eukprot:scaffold193291_cov35-Attheya_sp.AAC.1
MTEAPPVHDDDDKEEKDGVGLERRKDTGNARDDELVLLRQCQSPSVSVETLQRLLLHPPPSTMYSMYSMAFRRDMAACLLRHSTMAGCTTTATTNTNHTLDSCLDALM